MSPSDFWYEIDDAVFGAIFGIGCATVAVCVFLSFYYAGKRIFGGRDG